MTKINLKIISTPHAHLHIVQKTPVQFQKDRQKTVGGVADTRYLLLEVGGGRGGAEPQNHGKPNTMSLGFLRKDGRQQINCVMIGIWTLDKHHPQRPLELSYLSYLKFSVCVKERQDRLPTIYWLPKLHKRPYKARFIANSSSCTTTELSKLLTSCLTVVKNHVIRYCEKVYERSGKNSFWSIKNSVEVLNKLKSRGFRATSLSTYDFSTLYYTLPHNLIKEKLINLIEWTFKREGSPYIACNDRQAFFTSEDTKRYKLWSCQNVCEPLIYLLDNIYSRSGTKLYRHIFGIPMSTNCAPLVADLFLFCYERDFMTCLSDVKQTEITEAFKSTCRHLDDLLNIDNPYFEGMVNRIYPPELQLNKANTSDTEAPFLDLHLSISNGFVSSKIYDKRDDFDFDIVNFPFLDGDVPRSTSYGVYISQLIRFARVSSHVDDFNARNKSLTAKLLQQGYRYHKLRKTFSKFYRRHYELVSKFM